MALLQISEPGQSPEPHQRRLAIGIDLGTTNSLVATVRSSTPEVLADGDGEVLLPSVVRYQAHGKVTIGQLALNQAVADPQNTIISVKRLMGRGVAEAVAHGAHYDFVDAPGMVQLRTIAGDISPVNVSAQILATLRQRAEDSLGGDIEGAVITVPAYFDDAQRQATKDAAKLAGLKILRLLNEPTAAAVAYGLDQQKEGSFAVYDLGGGTFDVSILQLRKGVFEVIATGGDSALGGDDFDRAIVDWALAETGLIGDELQAADWRALLSEARRAKEALSSESSTEFSLQLSDATRVKLPLSLVRFEALTKALLETTLTACKNALQGAELGAGSIDRVVLVGGSTRMPQVGREVGKLFGSEPLVDLDPDQVVALGAALQANLLIGNGVDDEWLLLDVTPLSLGLETMGGLVEKLVPRNATIPVAKAQKFTTFKDGQTAMALHVVQGERELVADCRSLARFELRGIPAMAAGAAHIEVRFQIDADGLLSVTAREESTGVESTIQVQPSYGLGDDQIADMLKGAFASAEHDMLARALREQQVEARRLFEAIESALNIDGDLLNQHELDELTRFVDRLKERAAGDDTDAIRHAIDELSRATDDFAAKRMDRSIVNALSGRSIDEV